MTTEKTVQSPSPPSSDSLPSAQFLERLLGAIAKALDGLVEGNQELRKDSQELRIAFDQLREAVTQSSQRTEVRVTDVQAALTTFMQQVDVVVDHQKTVAAVTTDARRAMEDSRRSVDRAVDEFKEETGKHKTYQMQVEEREEISSKWIKVRWTTILRYVPTGIPIAVKVGALIAAGAVAIYEAIKNFGPLIKGWH